MQVEDTTRWAVFRHAKDKIHYLTLGMLDIAVLNHGTMVTPM